MKNAHYNHYNASLADLYAPPLTVQLVKWSPEQKKEFVNEFSSDPLLESLNQCGNTWLFCMSANTPIRIAAILATTTTALFTLRMRCGLRVEA